MIHISKAHAQTGVMVALFPTPATAVMLAQPGGEPAEDLHVTLAFLGNASDLTDPAGLLATVELFAKTASPIAGEVSGVGQFTAGPEPVTYASVDLPGLEDVRERLVDALQAACYPPSTVHGFTPHLTLAYDERMVTVPNLPLVFDEITVAIGGQRTSFPLTGAPVAKHDGPPPDHDQDEDDVHKADSGESLSAAAWNGSPAHFTDTQWQESCLLDRGATFHTPKTRYALPVREPDGTLNRRALAAAQAALNGGRGGVKAPAAAITAARSKLARLREQAGLTTTKAEAVWDVPIWKAQDGHGDEPMVVYGVVLHPGITDSQGDVVGAQEIEQAAHRFLVESRKHDIQHDEQHVPAVETVESYIAPADLEVAGRRVLKGSWVMATAIRDPQIKADVRAGRITGYSIGGTAIRSES